MAYPLQPLSVTSATYTLNEENVGNGAEIVLDRAAGITVTLPTSVGSGQWFRITIGTSVTSNSTIVKVANSTDVIQGVLHIVNVTVGTAQASVAGSPTSDTITMNGSTTGGLLGSTMILVDYKAGFWRVEGEIVGSGTITTLFSATV